MSFIARCPSCGTAFKVVADQLKISDGWVRCGQCQHIFDATLDLQPWWSGVELVDLNAPPPAHDTQPSSASAPTWATDVEPEEQRPTTDEVAPFATTDTATANEEAMDSAMPEAEIPKHGVLDEQPAPDVSWNSPAYVEEMAGYTGTAHPVPEALPDWGGVEQEDPNDYVPAADHSDLMFVRRAQRKAFWQRPAVLWGMSLLAALLLLALGLQWAILQRDMLATQVPVLKPVLDTACRPLGCRVGAGQHLDQFVIDSSALLRRGPDRFAFDMVLKNVAPQALVTPSLELTLTDAQDGVVVRRVLGPTEWPQAPLTLPAQSEHAVRLELALDAADAVPVVGYRAILFYP